MQLRINYLCLIAACAILTYASAAKAAGPFTVTLTPVADLAVDNAAKPPTTPFGESIPIDSGGKFALVRFDVGYIPLGARIVDARLALTFNQTAPHSVVISVPARPWVQEKARSNYPPQVSPETGTLTNSGGTYSGTILTDLVDGWLHSSRPNIGIAIRLDTGSELSMASKETADSKTWPQLIVTYQQTSTSGEESPSLNTSWPAAALEKNVFTHNVLSFGAIPNSKNDSTSAFQKAIDAAYKAGGGIVYAPHGRYRFEGSLKIPPGVTLRGDWTDPQRGGLGKGTILEILGGRDSEFGEPFLNLSSFGATCNLTFYYPDQAPGKIAPYPFTIQSHWYAFVRCITLVNSYQGLSHGYGNGSGGNLFAEHIYGTPLHIGLYVDAGFDYTNVSSLKFSPAYWEGYLRANAGLNPQVATAIRRDVYGQATGILTGYADTVHWSGVSVEGYRRGVDFATRVTGVRMNGDMDTVPSDRTSTYGQAYDIRLTGCAEALRLDDIQETGQVFCNCRFSGVSAVVSATNSPLVFERCEFHGSQSLVLSLSKDGRVVIGSSSFLGAGPASIAGGVVDIHDCRFEQTIPGALVLGKDVHSAVLSGDTFAKAPGLLDLSGKALVDWRAPSPSAYAQPPSGAALVRSPRSPAIVRADDPPFDVPGDGVTDAAAPLQRALDSLAPNGGTVFLSAGQYLLRSGIHIPKGVELRGVGEVVAHPAGGWISPVDAWQTSFLVEFGQGDENGTPAIRLGPQAGVRGISIVYPARNQTGALLAFPPAIAGEGAGCYVMMSMLANPYVGIEMRHCDDHLIKNILCGTDHVGVRIIGGHVGRIEGFCDVPAEWSAHLPAAWKLPQKGVAEAMAKSCTSIELEGCQDELVDMCGQWSTYQGIIVSGLSRTEQADVTLLLDTLDSVTADNVRLEGNTKRVIAIGLQVIMLWRPACTLHTTVDFDGHAEICGALLRHAWIDHEGPGSIAIEGASIFMGSKFFKHEPSTATCPRGSITIKGSLSELEQIDLQPNGRLKPLDNIDMVGVLRAAP